MYLLVRFSADVCVGKIYISITETQYDIFIETMCTQTVHVTAYKTAVC